MLLYTNAPYVLHVRVHVVLQLKYESNLLYKGIHQTAVIVCCLRRQRPAAARDVRMWMLCFLLASTHMAVARGYSTGAGEEACATMEPLHHFFHLTYSPQTTASPYSLTVFASTYSSNEEIILLLTGTQLFSGFMIQAHTSSGRAGTFSPGPEQEQRCSQVTGRWQGGAGVTFKESASSAHITSQTY